MTSVDEPRTAGGVRLSQVDGVATLTIDRPEARNAIGFATISELRSALDQVADSDAAVLVLRGGGDRAFVSGGDLKELNAVRTHEAAVEMARDMRRVLDQVASLPVPVIAALNGSALGGGAEVAIAADIRIAADDIRIGFNQVTLGIMPAWGGIERLAQVLGRGRALLAVTTGTMYAAADAHALGLLDRVVPRADFDAEVAALAAQLAGLAPGATRAVKSVLLAGSPTVHPHTEADATRVFAELWNADAHWDAVARLEQRRTSR